MSFYDLAKKDPLNPGEVERLLAIDCNRTIYGRNSDFFAIILARLSTSEETEEHDIMKKMRKIIDNPKHKELIKQFKEVSCR